MNNQNNNDKDLRILITDINKVDNSFNFKTPRKDDDYKHVISILSSKKEELGKISNNHISNGLEAKEKKLEDYKKEYKITQAKLSSFKNNCEDYEGKKILHHDLQSIKALWESFVDDTSFDKREFEADSLQLNGIHYDH